MSKDDLSIFLEPVTRTVCEGVPVQAYGFTYILKEAPTLTDMPPLQEGNKATPVKVRPKKSSEIKSNLIGGNAPRMPRLTKNDYLPLEPINLIDGDPDTCWSSRSQTNPNVEPVWIRIDLVKEEEISRIVLRQRRPGAVRNKVGSMPLDPGAVEVGMAMPRQLEIRLSRDGLNWETVYNEAKETTEPVVCEPKGKRAKLIWILGSNLQRVENWQFSFSIANVEIYDAKGRNQALASRGAGVTVNSTYHSGGQTIEEHHDLWPVHVDLGMKLVRIGYHDDPINWHWVEREKGVFTVDPEADASVTYLTDRGIDMVFCLGFGNRLYNTGDTKRKLSQLWEWYYENPEPPTTPEALDAWERFVRFIAEHFRDRVRYWEIWNEWSAPMYWGAEPNLPHFLEIAKRTIPILRKLCPEAKIVMGSFAGFCHGVHEWTEEQKEANAFLGSIRNLAKEVDVIGWHPFYQTSPEKPERRDYMKAMRAVMGYAEEWGFRGEYMATEWSYGANYPAPTPPNWWGDFVCSEIEKAKYVARLTVLHTGFGVASFFCETFNNTYPFELSLLRRGFSQDPITPLQPGASYYLTRNLSTAMDGLEPAKVDFKLETKRTDLESVSMRRPGEAVVSIWTADLAKDDCAGELCDLVVEGTFRAVTAYDPMNGTEILLKFQQEGNKTRVPKVALMDYPILWRLVEG